VSLALAGLGVALMALGAVSSTAHAEFPQRVGWWNTASANGAAAASPTTPGGGMRVAAGPMTTASPITVPQGQQILAYGAVLFALAPGESAKLQLKVAGTPQGTPQVVACPTQNTTWTGGDDQPASAEPAYDCGGQRHAGTVSADGTTITFDVKAPFESTPGLLSLAIVPDPGSTALPAGSAPFAVDIQPPDARSLAPTEAPASSPPLSSEAFAPPSTVNPGFGSAGQALGVPVASAPPLAPNPAGSAGPVTPGRAPQSGTRTPAAVAPIASNLQTSVRAHVASALGAATLIAATLVWSLGYGLLGGRVIPLSVPLRRV
jgi:hypothetical protein